MRIFNLVLALHSQKRTKKLPSISHFTVGCSVFESQMHVLVVDFFWILSYKGLKIHFHNVIRYFVTQNFKRVDDLLNVFSCSQQTSKQH